MNALERKKTIRNIVIFSILVNVVAWIAPFLGGSPSAPGLGFILWGVAPLLVSILLRAVTRDWSDLGIKPGMRKNAKWYGVSLLAFPVLMILTLYVGVSLSISTVSAFSIGEFLQTVLTALPFFLIFAIFEEVGWRGYLSPKLDALGINRWAGSAIVAVVWITWHMPYIRELTWAYSAEDLSTFIPRYYLLGFAFSILYGEIRMITGTFWPAVLMHGVTNAFAHPLVAEYVSSAAGTEYLGSISTGLILIVLVGLLGAGIRQWRIRKEAVITK